MSTAAILIVDIIGSKEIVGRPAGYAQIQALCTAMQDYVADMLTRLDLDGAVTRTVLPREGDNIAYQLEASSRSFIADVAIGAAIAAFLDGPSGKSFRYVAYTVDLSITYQPRRAAFRDISKLPTGTAHHFAIDRALVSALSDSDIADWLKQVPRMVEAVSTPGEAVTNAVVDFYCQLTADTLYPPLSFLRDGAIRGSEASGEPSLRHHKPGSEPPGRGVQRASVSTFQPVPRELRALSEVGEIQLARGKLGEARDTFTRGLNLATTLGVPRVHAQMMTNLGRVAAVAGDTESADTLFKSALTLNSRCGSTRGEAVVLAHIAALVDRKDPTRARDALLAAVEIEEDLGQSLALVFVANSAGRLLRRIGDLQGAAQMLTKAAEAAIALRHLYLACRNYGELGTAYRDKGSFAKARAAYEQSLAIAEANHFSFAAAITHDNLGRLSALEGNDNEAEDHFRKSLAVDSEQGSVFGMAKSHANLGVLYRFKGEGAKAHAFAEWKEADRLFREAMALGGRIESQAREFLRKLSTVRETLDRPRRARAKINDLFF